MNHESPLPWDPLTVETGFEGPVDGTRIRGRSTGSRPTEQSASSSPNQPVGRKSMRPSGDGRPELQSSNDQLENIRWLLKTVATAVNDGSHGADIKRRVCEAFCESEGYDQAWIGDENVGTNELVVSQSAGTDRDFEDAAISLTSDDPAARAVETGRIQTVADVSTLPTESVHRRVCGARSGAFAAIPLAYEDLLYCVLLVYVSETYVFDDLERAVFEALGTAISTAIRARDLRESLTADRVTEVELEVVAPEAFFVELSTTLECLFEFHSVIQQQDGSVSLFFDVSGTRPSVVVAEAADHADVATARSVTDLGDGTRLEFVLTTQPMTSVLADFGGEIRELTVEQGRTYVRAEFPSSADLSKAMARFEDRVDSVELTAYREAVEPGRTSAGSRSPLAERLTDRQEATLRNALAGGFYDWPRGASGEDLATTMNISPSTFHQHLRAAEKKLVEAFVQE